MHLWGWLRCKYCSHFFLIAILFYHPYLQVFFNNVMKQSLVMHTSNLGWNILMFIISLRHNSLVLNVVFWLAAKLREACFDPGNVMNGTKMGTDHKLGSMVTYNCEAGYLLEGYSTLTCVMGNSKRPEWDRSKPSCQGERQSCRIDTWCFVIHWHLCDERL